MKYEPISQNADLVNEPSIRAYCEMLFSYVDWGPRLINLRALGEKETDRYGEFRENVWVRPGFEDLPDIMARHCSRWAQYGIGAFMLPGVLRDGSANQAGAKDGDVEEFTTILIDIDSGHTLDKLQWLERAIGECSMLVNSGGITETGAPKLHAYWKLTEPCMAIDELAAYRGLIAAKVGGDVAAFKKTTQIIRIPGSVYCKGNVFRPVNIVKFSPNEIDYEDFKERANEMQPMPGVVITANAAAMNFHGAEKSSIQYMITQDIHEGGAEENRFSIFSRIAGHYLHQARIGNITVAEAKHHTYGWMQASMKPPWPDQRFNTEFDNLYSVDIGKFGPIQEKSIEQKPIVDSEKRPMTGVESLQGWAAHRWTQGFKPDRKFLVEGIILAGQPHLLAAEGGIGKTFLALDLALKVASFQHTDEELDWIGFKLTDQCQDKTVVMLTAEDDMTELHIRLSDIDPTRRRVMAHDRLIIIPLQNAGGAFALINKNGKGEVGPSPRWSQLYAILKEIPNLGLVIIDTLNSVLHGDDIQASVIQEFYREASRVCGELGAALLCTHHFRKRSKDPIKTLSDAAQAVRGSSAVTASNRVVIAAWEAFNGRRRLTGMGLDPTKDELFEIGVVKGNNPELFRGKKSLARLATGMLGDVTEKDLLRNGGFRQEDLAWLTFTVQKAAVDRHPLCQSGANGIDGDRKEQLPKTLLALGRDEMRRLIKYCIAEGVLITGSLADATKKTSYLDVPGGPVDSGQGALKAGGWKVPKWEMYFYNPRTLRIESKIPVVAQ